MIQHWIVYGLSGIAILGVIAVIFLNRGSDHLLEISIKSLLVPSLIAVVVVLVELLKPLNVYTKTIHIGVANKPELMVSAISSINSDPHQKLIMLDAIEAWRNPTDRDIDDLDFIKQITPAFLAIVMDRRFSSHWNSEILEDNWFMGYSSQISPRNDSSQPEKHITGADLTTLFPGNEWLLKISDKIEFSVPIDAQIHPINEEPWNGFSITTSHVNIKIQPIPVGKVLLAYSAAKDAEILKRKLGIKDDRSIEFIGFNLKIEATPNRWRRWSKETEIQMRWAKDIAEFIERTASWENFIEKASE